VLKQSVNRIVAVISLQALIVASGRIGFTNDFSAIASEHEASSHDSRFSTQAVVQPAIPFFNALETAPKVRVNRSIASDSSERSYRQGLSRRQFFPLVSAALVLASGSVLFGQTPTTKPVVKIDENWLRREFLASGKKLFDSANKSQLKAVELDAWIQRYVRPFDENFKFEVGDGRSVISKDQIYNFWERIATEVLEPMGYIAYPMGFDGKDRVGKIVRRTTRRSAMGADVPVLIVKPLKDSFMAPYGTMSFVIIPEGSVDDDKIWQMRRNWEMGWINSHTAPNYLNTAKPYENEIELHEWSLMNRIGPDQDLEAQRRVMEESMMEEELAHWDLFHYLQERRGGRNPFAWELDEMFEAMAELIFHPSWRERLKQEHFDFKKLEISGKILFINRLFEIQAQLRVLIRTSEPGLALMGFNRMADEIHGGAAAHVSNWLKPYVLQGARPNTDWTPGLISIITKGFVRGIPPGAGEFRRNLTALNDVVRKAAKEVYIEEFRWSGEGHSARALTAPAAPSQTSAGLLNSSPARLALPFLMPRFRARPTPVLAPSPAATRRVLSAA
jgi:hypothetical protein